MPIRINMTSQLKLLLLPLIKDTKLKNKVKSKRSLTESEKFFILDLIGSNDNLRKNVLIEEHYQELYQELSLKETT